MLKTQISKAQIDLLAEEVRTFFDPVTLEQGLEYQQKGLVYNAEVDGRTYKAKVQDELTCEVALDLDFLISSRCSCGAEAYCKHMAAAFFYAYSVYGHPDAFVKQISSPSGDKSNVSPSQRRIAAMTASIHPSSVRHPLEIDGLEQWLVYFAEQYRPFSNANAKNKAFSEDYFSAALEALIHPSAKWNVHLQKWFVLAALLFLAQKADEWHSSDFSRLGHTPVHLRKAASRLDEHIVQISDELTADNRAGRLDMFGQSEATEWIEWLRERAFAHPQRLTNWLDIYRRLWTGPLSVPIWVEREKRFLQEKTLDPAFSSWQRDRLIYALAHFDLAEGNDEAATRQLAQMQTVKAEYFIGTLRALRDSGQWGRLLHWLRWLTPAMKEAPQAIFNQLCDYWSETTKHLPCDEEWLHILTSHLPRSYEKWADYLLYTERYREWISLQLIRSPSPAEVPPAVMRIIEQRRPDALLPLYHQEVERLVVQRNRESYRIAVKWIKKLRSLYNDLGETSKFDVYVKLLSHRYNRLRSFQEELRKGKLV